MGQNKVRKIGLVLFCFFICFYLEAKTVTNDYCSFKIPTNMELQDGFLSDISNYISIDNENIYKAVLQQKGLNSTTKSYEGYTNNSASYNEYCRIIISCKEGTGGLGELNSDELDYFDVY